MVDTFSAAVASSSSSLNTHGSGQGTGTSQQVKNPSYFRALIEHVRKNAATAAIVQERIRGKGKGKEMLLRFEGEVVGAGSRAKTGSTVATGVDGRLKSGAEKTLPVNGESVVEVLDTDSGIVEDEVIVRDPRRERGFRKMNNHRPWRGEFVEVNYEVCALCVVWL